MPLLSQKSVSDDEEPLELNCAFCKKQYATKNALTNHIRIAHRPPMEEVSDSI